MESKYQYAGFKLRAAAAVFDFLIIFAYIGLLVIVGLTLRFTSSMNLGSLSPITMDIIAFTILILPVILYFSLHETSIRQATIGKQRMNLQVINVNGDRLSPGQSLLRSALKFLPWQMAHTAVFQITSGNESQWFLVISLLAQTLVLINLLVMLIDKQHRTLYDMLAGALVIHNPRILSINSRDQSNKPITQ